MKRIPNGKSSMVDGKRSRHFPFPIAPGPSPILSLSSHRTLPSTSSLLLPASCLLLSAFCLLFSSCMVGPKYQKPAAPVPAAYKEAPPDNSQGANAWKPAQPSDGTNKGKWWEIYNDPQLNSLEEQVSINNQNVLTAEAQFRAARDAVRIARAALFPTATVSPSYTRSGTSGTLFNVNAGNLTGGKRNIYDLPGALSYQADIWGSIRRSVTASVATAQASAAQLENARLSFQAELAQDYFQLHGTDGQEELLDQTVKSFQDYLELTRNRFNAGVASGSDVAQAETQLDAAEAQLVDLGVARAQFEHALAILIGKPPAAVTLNKEAIKSPPPPIPAGVPSTLLERRPDIAAAEREMASSNEEIGITKAAYFPSLLLSASGGFQSGSVAEWFTWPSRFFSVGPQFVETVLDAGKRHAQVSQAQALYDATVSTYRQTVLTGFQQVEDNLAALRVLENEARIQDQDVDAAKRSLAISTDQYKAGTASYLQVITAQTAALSAELSAVEIHTRRMIASVLLIEALGGGWDTSTLPTRQGLTHGK